jgi:glycosyltransferase involved in cell wall biosynthesis
MKSPSRDGTRSPTVSVLMAVYNGQNHVREAIDGVLGQTFRDFEFLIVDDGSTDQTPQILDGYTDSRIVRLKHPQNRGLIAALNTGLAAARGELVARQDADDFSFPNRLQVQVDFLRSRPDVALAGANWLFEPVPGGARKARRLERDPLRLAWLLLFHCPLTHSSVMFRRKIIQDLGGYGKDDLFAEDFALWSRVTRSYRIASVDETLVVRRRPPESITARHNSNMARAARDISLQNLEWVSRATISAARRDALQALLGNRPLTLPEALELETRDLGASAGIVFEGFRSRMKLPPESLPEFRKWAFQWMSRVLVRRSHKILAQSAAHEGAERARGVRLARSLALDAVSLSPAVILSRRGASAALRAIMSRA